MEGLSAAKRDTISSIVDLHNVDAICLQEAHVDADVTNRFSILGFDLVSFHLHTKHGRAVYVSQNLAGVAYQFSTTHCDVIKVSAVSIANVYRPPSEPWSEHNLLPSLPHPAVYVGDFNSQMQRVRAMICCWSMIQSKRYLRVCSSAM